MDGALTTDLPDRLRDRLEGRLAAGEAVRWVGRPNAGRLARGEAARAAAGSLFAAFVGGGLLAAGGLWAFAHPDGPPRPWVWWAGGTALGLAALTVAARARAAAGRARRTVYAVTDRRALVCRDLLFSPGATHEPATVERVRANTLPGGRGEVLFEPRLAHGHPTRREREATCFLALDDVAPARRAVERLLGRELPEENTGRSHDERSVRPPPREAAELPAAVRARLADELVDGERVLWVGRPATGVMVLRATVRAGCVFLGVGAGALLEPVIDFRGRAVGRGG